MTCPSDRNPEIVYIRDQSGIIRRIPTSYNENLEFDVNKGTVDRLLKPSSTVMLFDGHPSNLVGYYDIAKYNTQYATFRHLGRANAAFVDGHVESLLSFQQNQLVLQY
jgi:prepilin-type processing-associated H-X9-DG protein